MKIRKTFAATAVALGLLAGIAVVPAQAATTATGWDRCPKGYLCLFSGHAGSGSIAMFKTGDVNLGVGTPQFNNIASSVWNRTGKDWAIFDGINYNRTTVGHVWPGLKSSWTGGFWDNRVSSLHVG